MSLAVLAGRAGLVGLCLCALAARPDLPASTAQPVAAVLEREIEALVLLADVLLVLGRPVEARARTNPR